MADYNVKYSLATGECLTLTTSLWVIQCEYPEKNFTSPETRWSKNRRSRSQLDI